MCMITRQQPGLFLSHFVLAKDITDEDVRDKDKRQHLQQMLQHTGDFLLKILKIRDLPVI